MPCVISVEGGGLLLQAFVPSGGGAFVSFGCSRDEIIGAKTSMDDSEGDFSIQREASLSQFCSHLVTAKNLVRDLRTLVALTDPEDEILVQTPDGFKLPGQLENLICCIRAKAKLA